MITSEREPELRRSSFGELFHRLTDELTALVRAEIELAKSELTEKAKSLGAAAALIALAGIAALGAFGAFTAFAILLLATQMTAWLAALIVTVVYLVLAAGAGLVAKAELKHVAPHETTQSLQEDAAWAKAEIKSVKK